VIIPVKVPEPYLDELMERIDALPVSKEVLVQTEPGLSNAVRAGVERARGDIVAILDADGSHDPGYILEMEERLGEGHDLVLGSRYVDGGEANLGPVRGVISRVFTGVTRRVLGIQLEDPLTGMVVGERALFRRLVYADKSFKFTLELLQHAENPAEHPIMFKSRQKGESKVSLTQGLRSIVLLGTLYASRLNHRSQTA
jgi:dolichol-phosphate mannosyltransferase